ncbi:MAG: carboxypeptidase-like regulatory domain-containing protein, partial [Planctomycetota bacterium]
SSSYPSWVTPPVTNASGDVDLWLYPNGPYNTYTFTAAPPPGSPWAVTNLYNVAFTGDTSVTLTLASPVTLSGRVLDPLGSGLPNQTIGIAPWGTSNWIYQTTDSSGNYSFQVAPGDYQLYVYAYNYPSANLKAPAYYYLWATAPLSLTTSTTMNIIVPAKRVRVHVQDTSGLAVANVTLTTNDSYNPNLQLGTLPAYGSSSYPSWVTPPVTNASGDADLWLYPNGPYNTYTFTASPPPGSPFVTFNVYDVAFASDITVVVVLQLGVPPPPNACPVSQGFWKNHAEFWPVNSLTLGSQSYTQQELGVLLGTPTQGDASLILGHQLIAAKLNIAWGSDPGPIEGTLSSAGSLLSGYLGKLPYNVRTSSTQGKKMVSDAQVLDGYNNMLLTPRCDPLSPTLALTRIERDTE